MKNLFKYLIGIAFFLSFISGILPAGPGLVVAGGLMTVVMFSAEWFSIFFAGLTTLVILMAGLVWLLSNFPA